MNFKPFPLPSCPVRTKRKPKGKARRHRDQVPSIPLPLQPRPPPPRRDMLPYEYPPPSECPSMFTQLPVELILLIVDSLNLLQRARLMKTCRYFRRALEPILYRDLNLLDPDLYSKSGRIHRALIERPALISQIVTYHGPIYPLKADREDDRLPWSSQVHEDPRWSEGLTIFRNAVNIRDLYFTDYINGIGGYPWTPHRKAVDDMVLDRLVIQVQDGSADIVPLLRNQPELTRLELPWGGGEWGNLEATDIPKLRSLSATQEITILIVPGRPVDEINLLPSQRARWLDEDLLQRLSESTRPIRKFEMKYTPYNEDSVRDALRALARHLPSIEDLTIHVGGVISSQMLLSEIPAFGSIVSLTLLDAGLIHTSLLPTRDEASPPVDSLLPHDPDKPYAWADLEIQLRQRCPNFTSLRRKTLDYLGRKR